MFTYRKNNSKKPKQENSASTLPAKRQLTGKIVLSTIAMFLLFAIYKSMAWINSNPHLELSKFILNGSITLTEEDDIVQILSAISPLGHFFSKNIDTIHQHISQLQWVKKVSVRKEWPNLLNIYLVEYQPAAIWNNIYFIDDTGQLFSPPPRLKDSLTQLNLIKLYCSEGNEKKMFAIFKQLHEVLQKTALKIVSATMNDRHAWMITLENGTLLKLGRKELLPRLKNFAALYPVLIKKETCFDFIDLRYENGAAISCDQSKNGKKQNNR